MLWDQTNHSESIKTGSRDRSYVQKTEDKAILRTGSFIMSSQVFALIF